MRRQVKRAIDVVVAGVAIVMLSPVLATTAILVRLKLGSPVLFRQLRPGLHGESFTLLKFRTMLVGDESDHERLTPFGAKLRSTSLDELPELVNILLGEMSLVGPRPLLTEYLPLYTDRQSRRHDVRPGLTGLAQASGRNDLDWDDRLELDVHYVETQSFRLDAKVVALTVKQLIGGSGVSAEGEATMSKFKGSA